MFVVKVPADVRTRASECETVVVYNTWSVFLVCCSNYKTWRNGEVVGFRVLSSNLQK